MAQHPLTALKIVRLAELVTPDEWVRPLAEWEPPPRPEPKEGTSRGARAEMEQNHAEEQFQSLV